MLNPGLVVKQCCDYSSVRMVLKPSHIVEPYPPLNILQTTKHFQFNSHWSLVVTSTTNNLLTPLPKQNRITDDKLIPTGELKAVQGTNFDFSTAQRIGARLLQDELLPGWLRKC